MVTAGVMSAFMNNVAVAALMLPAIMDITLTPFGLFDYAPVGIVVMIVGTAFMAFVGRHLLPKDHPHREGDAEAGDIEAHYHLKERMFMLGVPYDSSLAGRTLGQSRFGSVFGLNVVAIIGADDDISLGH